jgi:hypothetical protein
MLLIVVGKGVVEWPSREARRYQEQSKEQQSVGCSVFAEGEAGELIQARGKDSNVACGRRAYAERP